MRRFSNDHETVCWVQEMDQDLAVVKAQRAYVLSQQGQPGACLDLLTQVLTLNLQSDVATHALCTSNALALRARQSDAVPKVRCLLGHRGFQVCASICVELMRTQGWKFVTHVPTQLA